jgi:TolB-like protein/predicted transcriptional regulator
MQKGILFLIGIFFSFYVNAKTIAISYFDNSSGDAKYNALSKGIADMLITDLSKIKGVTIVEREKLEKLIQEIKLGQSKYFDPTTAQKLGKGLGAQNILTGSFYILDNTIRMDARLIDVQTGGIIFAEQVSGNKNNFFALHQQLANLLAKKLNIPYSPDLSGLYKASDEVTLTEVVNFSNALELQDEGMNGEAKQLLEKTIKTNPKFHFAQNKLDEIKEWLKKIELERERLITEELKNTINTLDPANEKFGTQVSNVWTTLLTSYKYNQLVSFNNSLRKMKLDEKKKIYGDASPLTLGEMMLFYDCTALNALKKYEEVIETSKLFITNYPTSFYFQSIKMNLEQSIKELEHRSNGKKGIDSKLSAESLDAYINYLNKLEWKSNLQFVNEKEYKNYLNLYKSQVLDTKKETLDAWDESSKFNEFTNFFDVAAQFNDTKTMEEIVSVSKKLFTEADDQDRIFSLENKVEDFKTKTAKNSEKINELENTANKGSKADLEKVIKWHFSNEQYNRPDLLLEICNRYISDFKPSSESEMAICLDAWDGLITNTAKLKGLDEAKKLDETLKGKAEDFKTVKTDYDKTVREVHQDIKNLQNDFTSYQKNVKNNDPMISVLEKYATIYKDNHQYTEEAYTRKQLMNLFKLDADKEQLQLFLLAMCYYNLGYFDNVQKTATILKEKYPTSTYTESINSITSYMPQ